MLSHLDRWAVDIYLYIKINNLYVKVNHMKVHTPTSMDNTSKEDLIDRLLADWRKERPDLDCEPMSIVGRLIYLGTLLKSRAADTLQPYGISYTDLDLLATLRRMGHPYQKTPTELMETILLSSGAMTAALSRLEAQKYIKRGTHPRDGRVKTVSLTNKGLRLIDKTIEVRFGEAENAIQVLSAEEMKMLKPILRKLALHLKSK